MIENDIGVKLKEIEKRKGFRKIFEALAQKKAVWVGHNCIIDILFTISHFGNQLPGSLNDFKTMLKGYFNEYILLTLGFMIQNSSLTISVLKKVSKTTIIQISKRSITISKKTIKTR
jgi:hypothetical protein